MNGADKQNSVETISLKKKRKPHLAFACFCLLLLAIIVQPSPSPLNRFHRPGPSAETTIVITTGNLYNNSETTTIRIERSADANRYPAL